MALPADAKQRLDVARALQAVADAELALGWSQVPNAKVRALVRDPEQARAFLKEMLDGVTVRPGTRWTPIHLRVLLHYRSVALRVDTLEGKEAEAA